MQPLRRNMWSKVVESGNRNRSSGQSGRKGIAEVTIQQNPTNHSLEQLQISTSFVALVTAAAKIRAGKTKGSRPQQFNVSRQSPNSRRRKGTAQSPCGRSEERRVG